MVPRRLRYIEKCAAQAWHLKIDFMHPTTGELTERRVPFRCRSWRHKGDCQRWRASQNFARIRDAFAPLNRRSVVFMVLTLDPKDWRDRFHAFADLSERWSALRKAITRAWGANDWVGTVEVHRSGWPHMNIVMHCPIFANASAGGAQAWLRRHASACGFGRILRLQRAKSKHALAGYVVKVAGELEQAAQPGADGRLMGEVVKFSQVPEEAPRHFRRLRSSVRFLPPPTKSANVHSGELVKEPLPKEAHEMAPQPEELEALATLLHWSRAHEAYAAAAPVRTSQPTQCELWRETG